MNLTPTSLVLHKNLVAPKSNIYYFNLLSVLYTDSKRPACAHDAGKGFRAR